MVDTAIVLSSLVLLLVLWILPLIDVMRRSDAVFMAARESRSGWLARVLLGGSIGGLLYLLTGYRRVRRIDAVSRPPTHGEKVKVPTPEARLGRPSGLTRDCTECPALTRSASAYRTRRGRLVIVGVLIDG